MLFAKAIGMHHKVVMQLDGPSGVSFRISSTTDCNRPATTAALSRETILRLEKATIYPDRRETARAA